MVEYEQKSAGSCSARTHTCTLTLLSSVDTTNTIFIGLEVGRYLGLKPATIFDPKAHNICIHHKSHMNNIINDTSITTAAIPNTDDTTTTILLKNARTKMVRFPTKYRSDWQKYDEKKDQENVDLSPQMIKTTTDLATTKADFKIAFDSRNGFDLCPKPGHILGAFERNNTIEVDKPWFSFEETNALPQKMNIDKMKCHSVAVTLDTKTSTEEQSITSDGSDDSTIVSSSSSAVYELFDDVSVLTNEDFLFENSDVDGFNVNVLIFEDILLLTGDIEEGGDVSDMVHDSKHFESFEETHHCKQQKDSMSNGHNQFDFFSGVNFEEGFTPSDELRMA